MYLRPPGFSAHQSLQRSLSPPTGIELADSADIGDVLEVDMLIGSDFYWSLVTGRVRWGRIGPMAVHTKIGWILSGPVD